MKKSIYLLPVVIVLILAGFFWFSLGKDPNRLKSVLIDQKLPLFDLSPIQGYNKGITNADFQGQVTLLNIFGSWCIACRVEHPLLMHLAKQQEVIIYGINWREKDPNAGSRWLRRHGNPYRLIGNDSHSKAAIALGVTGAPESFIIDKKGYIRYKHMGPIDNQTWYEILKPIIEDLRKK